MDVSGGRVVWDFTVDNSRFNKALADSDKRVEQTSQNLKKADRDGQSFADSLGKAVGKLADDFAGLGRAVAAVGRTLATVAATAFKALAAGAAVVTAGLTALAVKGVDSAKQIQTLQISMNGLTKSMELGAEAMAAAYKYAQKAPFQLPDVAGTTKTLLAYGRRVQDVAGDLETLGNVSITTGVPIEALGNIFGRVSAQGRLMGGDIQQLTENGVAILPALQSQLGKTAEEVREMASAGEISFAQFNKAMQSLVDPKILQQLENTLPRQIDRLGGSLRILSNAFVGVGVDAVRGFSAAGDGIYQQTINITRTVADILRGPGVLAAAGEMGRSIAIGLGAISEWVDANKPKIDAFFGDFAGYLKTINDIAQDQGIGAGFARIGEDIQKAFAKIDFEGMGKNIMDGLKKAFDNLDLVDTGKKLLESFFKVLDETDLAPYTETMVKAILQIFTAIDYAKLAAGAVAILIKAVPDIISGLISGIIDTAINNPMDLIEFILAIGFLPGKFVTALGAVLGKIPFVGPLLEFFLTGFKTVADFILAPVKNLLGKAGHAVVDGIKDGFLARTVNLRAGLLELKNIMVDFFTGAGQWLLGAGRNVVGGLTSGLRSAGGWVWDGIVWVASHIGRLFSNAGSWLWDAGRAIISGLVNGIKSAAGWVKDALGDLTKKIGDWKGPMSVDKRLLVPNAQAIIGGFVTGLEGQYGRVQQTLAEFTNGLYTDQSMLVTARADAPVTDGNYGMGAAPIYNTIDTINIGSEVDGENWLRKLTRDEEVTSQGLTGNDV
jgi:tape measure domain-containing protein